MLTHMLTHKVLVPFTCLHIRTLRQRCPETLDLEHTRSCSPLPQSPARLQRATQAGFQVKNPQEPQAGRYGLLTCNLPHGSGGRGGVLPGTTCSLTQPDKVVARGHVLATGGAGTLPGTPGKLEARVSLSAANSPPLCHEPETLPSHGTWIAPTEVHNSSEPTGNAPHRGQKPPQGITGPGAALDHPHKKQQGDYLISNQPSTLNSNQRAQITQH